MVSPSGAREDSFMGTWVLREVGGSQGQEQRWEQRRKGQGTEPSSLEAQPVPHWPAVPGTKPLPQQPSPAGGDSHSALAAFPSPGFCSPIPFLSGSSLGTHYSHGDRQTRN